MVNFLIFGPPGSGKGTQSVKLAEKFNLKHLSTGDMLRAEIAAGTELGKKMSSIMSRGELVPDEVVIEMIANKIDSTKNAAGFLFDGFPRTVAQTEVLEKMLIVHEKMGKIQDEFEPKHPYMSTVDYVKLLDQQKIK